jgi:flagellar hook-basal body complex protein FliE
MVDSLNPISSEYSPLEIQKKQEEAAKQSGDATDGANFKDVLKKSIQEVNQLQQEADEAIQELAMGKRDDYAGVITAVQKADVAFRTLMQVRNKLIDAYQEFNRMRV